jgi:alkylation response protein AidB-like acyl-CoA dehydrogenase
MTGEGMAATEEERQAIGETAADFCRSATEGTKIFDAMTTRAGYDPRIWTRMTQELGLAGLLVPEPLGGLGLGFSEAAIVLAETGRSLLPSPLLPTLAMTKVLLHVSSDPALDLLAKATAQGASISLAISEGNSSSVDSEQLQATRAEGHGAEFALTGEKDFVLYGDSADILLVTARDGDDVGLYAVDGDATGLRRMPHMTLDQTRRLARLDLRNVRATRLTRAGAGEATAAYARNIMLVALAVEAAASADECLVRTVAYLNVREQFGRVLGSFQALRHRCANIAVQVQGALATAHAAVEAVDGPELGLLAPLARAVCGDAFLFAAGEMIQLHGGIGFTFEHHAHLYLKRAVSTQVMFGSSDELRDEVGDLAGI